MGARHANYSGNFSTTANSNRGPSPGVWSRYDALGELEKLDGIHIWEDFIGWDGSVTTNVGRYHSQAGSWRTYEDTSATLLLDTSKTHGVLEATTPATDNLEVTGEFGDPTEGIAKVTYADGGPKFFFEARVQFGQIVTQNFFLGLAVKTRGVTDGIFTDSDAYQDIDLIGFGILAGDSDELHAIRRKNGGTATEIGDVKDPIVADTWYKVGMIYDKQQPYGKILNFFLDGVELGGVSVDRDGVQDSNFPDDVILKPTFSIKNSTTAANIVRMDWIRFAQLAA